MRRRRRVLLWIAAGAVLNTLWRAYGDRMRAKVRDKLYGAPEAPDTDSVAYQLDQCVSDVFRGGHPDLESVEVQLPGEGLVLYAVDEVKPFIWRGSPWPRSVEQE